jgi:putative addiction module component (TIGR02574 family)
MSQAILNLPQGFDELSIDEKIEYVQLLWERIVVSSEEIPVPDWHAQLVENRLRSYRRSPDEGRPWEEIREKLEQKFREQASKK